MSIYPMPAWLDTAYRYRGLKEIPGAKHNPIISGWLKRLKAWWTDDETPWCGTFIAHCMENHGIALPKHWYRAKAWLDWGVPVSARMGAVGVKGRVGGGHVFFYVGEDATHYHCLGGNQSNEVNVTRIKKSDVIGWRWPLRTNEAFSRFQPNYVNAGGVKTGGTEA